MTKEHNAGNRRIPSPFGSRQSMSRKAVAGWAVVFTILVVMLSIAPAIVDGHGFLDAVRLHVRDIVRGLVMMAIISFGAIFLAPNELHATAKRKLIVLSMLSGVVLVGVLMIAL